MHTVLCLLKTFNSQTSRERLGLEHLYSPCMGYIGMFSESVYGV